MGNCASGDRNGSSSSHEIAKYKNLIHEKEYNLLKLIYFDLGARDKSHSLTIQNFLLFFHKNGYWGNRLFKEFDADKSNLISEEEFIKGIVKVFKTSEEQKIQLLFKFFSNGKSRDKGVPYKEFLTMLYNYPKEQIKNILNDEDFVNKQLRSRLIAIDNDFKGHRLDSVCPGDIINAKISNTTFKLDDNDSQDKFQSKIGKDILNEVNQKSNDRAITTLRLKVGKNDVYFQTASIHNVVKKFAKTIFKEYKIDTETGTLKLSDFTDWMLKHKKLYNDYYHGFHNEIWEIEKVTQKPLFLLKQYEFSSKAKMEIGSIKDKKVIISLLHSILLIFYQSQPTNPILIVCLEGLAAKPIFMENHGHGIQITHRDGVYQNRAFYFMNQQLQKQWMSFLKFYKGSSISQMFDMGQKIGIGKFSIVYSCIEKSTKEQFAIKVIESYKLNDQEKKIIAHESSIMSILCHPLTVSFKESIQTKTHIYIITELVKGKDLYQFVRELKFLGESEAAYIIKQVIIGVRYLHSLGIVHRDLKPENIMVEYDEKTKELGKIKIIDFGFASYLSTLLDLKNNSDPSVRNQLVAGTPNYIAPQLLYASQGEPAVISEKIDNFSIGSILYTILSGELAFESKTTGGILHRTMEGSYITNNKKWKKISQSAKNLVSNLLDLQPTDRISLEDALNHRWFRQVQPGGAAQPLIRHKISINSAIE